MIEESDIERIEQLAQLKLTKKEKGNLGKDLARILDHFQKIDELDTEDIEPLRHILEIKNVLREDRASEPLPRDLVLKNAPSHWEGFFEVPKVVDKEKKDRE